MLDFSVTFIITLINLGVLFVVLRAILFKPVTKFIEARAKKVQDARDEAERSKAEAEKLVSQLEERLKNAGDEAAEILRAAREEAGDSARAIVAQGKADAEQFLAQARIQAQAEYQGALRVLQAEAAALVASAAGRLVHRNFSDADGREQAAALLRDMDAFFSRAGTDRV